MQATSSTATWLAPGMQVSDCERPDQDLIRRDE
jgi:hypothetical protein